MAKQSVLEVVEAAAERLKGRWKQAEVSILKVSSTRLATAQYKQFRPSDEEILNILGDDMEYLADNEERLVRVLEMLCENRMIEAGVVPPGFVYPGACQSCGDVLLEHHSNSAALSCPWCFSERLPKFYH